MMLEPVLEPVLFRCEAGSTRRFRSWRTRRGL